MDFEQKTAIILTLGDVAEWLKAPVSKTGIWETGSGVRILSSPPCGYSPPLFYPLKHMVF